MKKTLLGVSLLFASPAWALSVSEPVELSQPEFKNNKPKVAVNEEGEAVVAWVAKDLDSGVKKLSGATLDQAKKWSMGDISLPAEEIYRPRIFIDAKGNAYAQWKVEKEEGEDDTTKYYQFAKKEKGSLWSTEVTILGPNKELGSLSVKFDAHGNALFLGEPKIGNNDDLLGALTYLHEPGEKKLTKIATGSGYAANRRLVENSQGGLFAVWTESVSGFDEERKYYNKELVQGAWSQGDFNWSKPVNIGVLDQSGTIDAVKAVMNSTGNMVLLVAYRDTETHQHRLQAFICKDRQWSNPTELAQSKEYFSDLQVSFNDSDHAIVAWTTEERNKEAVYAVEKSAEGSWSSPALLMEPSHKSFDLKVKQDDQGNVLAVWTAKDKRKWTPFAAYKPAGQNWEAAVALTDGKRAASGIDLWANNTGKFGVIWEERRGCGASIFGASLSTSNREWKPVAISPEGQVCGDLSCAVDKKGKGVIAWLSVDPADGRHVQAAELSLD
jgi:hypothetical protein